MFMMKKSTRSFLLLFYMVEMVMISQIEGMEMSMMKMKMMMSISR